MDRSEYITIDVDKLRQDMRNECLGASFGGVLIEAMGMKMSRIDGKPLDLQDRQHFLAATPTAYQQILTITQGNEE